MVELAERAAQMVRWAAFCSLAVVVVAYLALASFQVGELASTGSVVDGSTLEEVTAP